MRHLWLSLAMAATAMTFAACDVETRSEFDARPFEASKAVQRNYQAVYADVLKGARYCWDAKPDPLPTLFPQSIRVDAQLYPDLGYGEVSSSAIGTVKLVYALVRVEKSENGAVVKVKPSRLGTGRSIWLDPPMRWADGDISCD